MSSPSERRVTFVTTGEGGDPEIRALLAAGASEPRLLSLTGAEGDGRRLLEAIATSDQVVYSPWPAGGGDGEPGGASAAAFRPSTAPR